jgi:DNA primase
VEVNYVLLFSVPFLERMMPAIDYRAARTSIRLLDVLALIAYQPVQQRGEQWRGPCPLHGSHTATSRVFAVHLSKNVYHCFRCGAGGNALDLWAALTQQPLHAAVLELCHRLGQPVPWLQRCPPRRCSTNNTANHERRGEPTMPIP